VRLSASRPPLIAASQPVALGARTTSWTTDDFWCGIFT